MPTITISFKVSTGSTFDLEVDSAATIATVKQLASASSGIPDSQMRLIYKGRILKDGETLDQNKIEHGHVLHLVKGPGASVAPAAPVPAATPAAPVPAAPTGVNPPADAASLLGNPAMQQMMGVLSQNPELLATMLRANPQFQTMAAQNPHLNLILQNPDLLRVMMNPQMMQAALQMQQAVATGAGGGASTAGLMQLLAQANPAAGEEQFDAPPPPPAAVAELELRFGEQLEQMALMGFTDRLHNIEALRVCDGNVEAAINYLLTYGN
jgi:ubiquilin